MKEKICSEEEMILKK